MDKLVSVSTAVTQSIALIKGGHMLGGSHKDTPERDVVYYYMENGDLKYRTLGEIDGHLITQKDLEERLKGHFNSLSEEECVDDCNKIDTEYKKYLSATAGAEQVEIQAAIVQNAYKQSYGKPFYDVEPVPTKDVFTHGKIDPDFAGEDCMPCVVEPRVVGPETPAFWEGTDLSIDEHMSLSEDLPPRVGKLPRTPTGVQVTSADIVTLLTDLDTVLYADDLQDETRTVLLNLLKGVDPLDMNVVRDLEIYRDLLNDEE